MLKMITAIKKIIIADPQCLCPQECDCQCPPPDDWDGVAGAFGISEECPIHNLNPSPNPECPIHGNQS